MKIEWCKHIFFSFDSKPLNVLFFIKAKENNISPFYLLIPTVTSINLSFMLPIATPTNSVIFASGYVKSKDMVNEYSLVYNFQLNSYQ